VNLEREKNCGLNFDFTLVPLVCQSLAGLVVHCVFCFKLDVCHRKLNH